MSLKSRMPVRGSTPDFLGIGAHKAATNWIWHNLYRHPDVWMPPIKEIHYFDRSPRYPSPSYLSSPSLAHRLLGREKYNVEFRRLFIRKLGSVLLDRNWPEFRWRLKHFRGYYDNRWYVSLFEGGGDKLNGEITPSYSILDLPEVRKIRDLLPDLKIILMLRNPIDRAWSHVRFDWTRDWFQGINEIDKIKEFIDGPKQCLRGNYLRMLQIWEACFPAKQIFIGFYDDVLLKPQELLERLARFLDIPDRDFADDPTVREKKNVSGKRDIPDEILIYLAKKYQPDIARLERRFGGHTSIWLRDANRILEQYG